MCSCCLERYAVRFSHIVLVQQNAFQVCSRVVLIPVNVKSTLNIAMTCSRVNSSLLHLHIVQTPQLTATTQLQNRNIRSLKTSLPEIRDIVASNEKQRFSLIHISALESSNTNTNISSVPDSNNDNDPTHYLIRANQGHSIPLDTSDLLTPITLDDPSSLPDVVVHGTRHDAWPLILESGGLKRMGRNHVHFATGVPEQLQTLFREKSSPSHDDSTTTTNNANENPEANENDAITTLPEDKPTPTILSGMRNSSTLLIYINLRSALAAGLKFYKSENGVVLSEGEAENGVVGVQFFEKVVEKGGRVLVRNGKVVLEADEGMLGRAGRGAVGRGARGGGARGGGRGEGRDAFDGAAADGGGAGREVVIGRGGMAAREAARGPLGVVDDN